MGTDAATGLHNGKKAPPPALPLLRIHPRTTKVVGPDDDGTPALHTHVTVPFLWEDAPGRPKPNPHDASIVVDPTAPGTDVGGGGDPDPHQEGGGDPAKEACVLIVPPLKLPPRLQVVPMSKAADRDASLSPKTVLRGPYYGCTGGARRPPPRTAGLRRAASFRRAPSTSGFFSRRKAGNGNKAGGREVDAAAPDASSCSSPSPSSASSSSSSASFFFFGDERGHGTARADAEEGETAQGSSSVVRITRFRRNRSLPTITTSHLWASIRKSVKQIAPWS